MAILSFPGDYTWLERERLILSAWSLREGAYAGSASMLFIPSSH